MADVALIAYPGQKVELAILRHIQAAGLSYKVFREFDNLNELARSKSFLVFGALNQRYNYNRAAVIAEHDLSQLLLRVSQKRKPILGIGFGADILTSLGLLPGESDLKKKLGVTRKSKFTQNPGENQVLNKISKKNRTPYTHLLEAKTIELNLNAVQAQFISQDPDYYTKLLDNKQIVFEYPSDTEDNSLSKVAAICNPEGNVLGILSNFYQDISSDIQIFQSLRLHIDKELELEESKALNTPAVDYSLSKDKQSGETILLEESSPALDRFNNFLRWYLGKGVTVKEYIHYELLNADVDKVRASEALLSPNTIKEVSDIESDSQKLALLVKHNSDLSGQFLTEELVIENHVPVSTINKSILWVIEGLSPEAREHLLNSGLLFNPNYQSAYLYQREE